MLQAIRGKSASLVVKILLVLLIISFGAWGINDYIGVSFNDRAPVVVNGKELPLDRIDRPFRRQVSQIQQQLGGDFTMQQAMQLGLLDQVISEVGTRAAVDQYLADIGLVPSDETIKTALRETPAFLDENGNFDRARFEGALFQSGLSQEAFIASLQQDIVQDQLINSVASGLAAPQPMVEALYRYRGEERVVDLLELPYDQIRSLPEPSDEELQTHLDDFSTNFQTPEYRTVRLLALTPETVSSDVLVTDDGLRAAYDDRISQFTTPERRTVRQIVLPDLETAQQTADRIRSGEAFTDVAVSLAGMEAADTELGAVSQGDLFGDTGSAVFQAPIGGITNPVETAFGWHVFLIEDSTPGSVQTFDAVRDLLEAELRTERSLEVVYDLINDVEDIQAGGGSVENISSELNLDFIRIDRLSPAGTLQDGSLPAGLPVPSVEVASLAFSTEVGSTSPARQIGEGTSYIVVEVIDVTAPIVPALADIRVQVAASWREEQRRLLAIEEAETIAGKAMEGMTIDALADDHDVTLRNSPPFKRTGEGLASLPAAIAGTAFVQNIGDVGVAEGPDAAYVVQLTSIQIPDPAIDADGVAALSEETTQSLQGGLQGSIAAAIVGRYPIEVDRGALDRLYGDRGVN